jgi:hypothetical protein
MGLELMDINSFDDCLHYCFQHIAGAVFELQRPEKKVRGWKSSKTSEAKFHLPIQWS